VTSSKISFEPDWDHDFDQRILARYKPLGESALEKAREIKILYDRAVRRILAQLNLATEFELWTGFAMSKPVVGSDYKRQEVLGQEAETLRLRYRELCQDACGGCDPSEIDPFVAAMYQVTADETSAALAQGRLTPDTDEEEELNREYDTQKVPAMPLITFPWLFPEVMVRIAMGDEYKAKRPWYAAGRQKRTSPR
jgi:RNA-dependent RNA polymerase